MFHCAAGTSGSECVFVASRYLQIGYTGRRLLPLPCAKFFVRFQRVFLPFKKNIEPTCSLFFYFAPSRKAAKFLKKNSVSLWLCKNHLKILCVLASWRENFYAVYGGRFCFARERIAGKIRVPLRRRSVGERMCSRRGAVFTNRIHRATAFALPCAKFFVRFQRVFLPLKNIEPTCSLFFYFAPSREAAKFLKKKLCVSVAL